MNDSNNSDIDKNLIADHEYDGIQELDNPLPKWWLFTFYITIVFSAFYIPYYHFFGGQNPREEYQAALAQIEAKKIAETPAEETGSNQVEEILKNPQALELGQEVYTAKCAACHGSQGQGVIGPNLTDYYWINGDGSSKSVLAVIRDGVTSKGMPPWGSVITPDELNQVTAYVLSIVGTQPPNPKAPQGQERKTASN